MDIPFSANDEQEGGIEEKTKPGLVYKTEIAQQHLLTEVNAFNRIVGEKIHHSVTLAEHRLPGCARREDQGQQLTQQNY